RQFELWMRHAIDAKVEEPNAMTLATSGKGGVPDARVVLLRDLDRKGFVFFTNYTSRKGKELTVNKRVCLNFFWPELQRQVRILGRVEKITSKASDSYFNSRPRQSQIGAWASLQSEVLDSRAELEERFVFFEKKFQGKKVPRPAFWGGYRVVPEQIEFWQGRRSRLHDRICYLRSKVGRWKHVRLYP
ncbi:MAG: pyridoxamine 5'-phosphate oxidase, partial [Bacteroidota bacterium]